MPFDGSGNFNRTQDWTNDASANIKIRADRHDINDDDIAAGLSQCITKNGQTTIAADIPWNGHKLTNVGTPAAATDAATKGYVDSIKTFSTGIVISGADANGRVAFGSTTGVNGLTWTAADLSLLGKVGVANQTQDRLVINSNAAASGSDVWQVDMDGRVATQAGQLLQNLSWDGAQWRTPGAGIGTMLSFASGAIKAWANDTATAASWLLAGIRNFFSVSNVGGSVQMLLNKSASGKANQLIGQTNGSNRWIMTLGDGSAEGAGNAGSDFSIGCYDNAAASLGNAIVIDRATRRVFTPVGFTGPVDSSNGFNADTGVYGGSGTILYLRPGGFSVTSNQASIDAATGDMTLTGNMKAEGYLERAGTTGSYGTEFFNFNWVSPNLVVWVNGTNVGQLTPSCDYRLKADVHPLASTWAATKELRPVSFTWRDYAAADGTKLSTASPDVQWGFIAHELQETLLPSAATGTKDAPDQVQGPNLVAIVAALAATLQEAQARIEALEERAA